MLKQNIIASLVFLFCAGIVTYAQDNPFLGKWDITGTGQNSNHVYWLEVKMEGGKLVGYFLNRGGSVTKLPEIAIENGELVFSPSAKADPPKPIHRAKVEEGRLLGMLTVGDREVAWIGVRPPDWGEHNANSKHKFGTPVALFDGKTMDSWDVQHKDRPSGWTVVDGAMTNEAKANNLVSKHRFENFKIRCEYKVEEKSNSGIYLRGRYELQVLDDAGKEPESHGHMALYSRIAPLVNASLPAGQWQAMEATIVGNRLTVLLNGKKVHDNITIDGITGGALDSNEREAGPIMLQGDHGKVWFRKVVVTPILK
jgi:Domain of Unknown Function (DUF1080)